MSSSDILSLHYSLAVLLLSCFTLYQIEVAFLQQVPEKGGTYLRSYTSIVHGVANLDRLYFT